MSKVGGKKKGKIIKKLKKRGWYLQNNYTLPPVAVRAIPVVNK